MQTENKNPLSYADQSNYCYVLKIIKRDIVKVWFRGVLTVRLAIQKWVQLILRSFTPSLLAYPVTGVT